MSDATRVSCRTRAVVLAVVLVAVPAAALFIGPPEMLEQGGPAAWTDADALAKASELGFDPVLLPPLAVVEHALRLDNGVEIERPRMDAVLGPFLHLLSAEERQALAVGRMLRLDRCTPSAAALVRGCLPDLYRFNPATGPWIRPLSADDRPVMEARRGRPYSDDQWSAMREENERRRGLRDKFVTLTPVPLAALGLTAQTEIRQAEGAHIAAPLTVHSSPSTLPSGLLAEWDDRTLVPGRETTGPRMNLLFAWLERSPGRAPPTVITNSGRWSLREVVGLIPGPPSHVVATQFADKEIVTTADTADVFHFIDALQRATGLVFQRQPGDDTLVLSAYPVELADARLTSADHADLMPHLVAATIGVGSPFGLDAFGTGTDAVAESQFAELPRDQQEWLLRHAQPVRHRADGAVQSEGWRALRRDDVTGAIVKYRLYLDWGIGSAVAIEDDHGQPAFYPFPVGYIRMGPPVAAALEAQRGH